MFRLIPKTVLFLLPLLMSTPLLQAQDPPVNASLLGQWGGYGGSYADVWAEGQYAYVGTYGGNVVHIIDMSNPAAPTLAGQVVAETGSAQDVKVHNGLLFIPGGDVLIIDVRDPANPVTLVNVNLSGISEAHNTFYEDGYLYIVDSWVNKVGIVDLTAFDPDNPPPGTITEAKWILTNVGSSFVHDITVQDGRLYACAWGSGLWIYDVTDVADTEPSFLGSTPGSNRTHSCWPSPDGRFVVTGEEWGSHGIKVFEIMDNGGSLTLTLTDSLVLPETVHNQFVIGYRLYSSWYQAGLQVFDIDPVAGTLSFVASYDTYPGSGGSMNGAWGVYPANGDALILISDRDAGLYLIGIDPDSIATDCNINGIDDSIDLASGTSTDCNGNGIPDECEPLLDHDCNGNGTLDLCDIAGGSSTDCNGNGMPDDCEPGGNQDCNGNGVVDFCDIFWGTSGDLNANGVPDDCEPHQIIYTDLSNCPGPGSGSEADPFCTIQEAIDAAGDGLSEVIEIVVADGVYTGVGNKDLDFGGRLITVRSAGGPESCVIDCQGSGRGFYFHNGETAGARVEGFTITDCDPEGVRCEESSPTISGCTITGNTGDGVYCYVGPGGSSDPIINDCTITENTGQGVWCAGSDEGSSSPSIRNCMIAWNEGTGVYSDLKNSSKVRVSGCEITGNYVGVASNDDAIITDSTITGHTLFGIACSRVNNRTQISNCTIAGNAGYYGGGVYCALGARAWITDCTIAGNTASHYGGGVACQHYGSSVVLSGCTIAGNAAGRDGGGLHSQSEAILTVIDCVITGNVADRSGGGVYGYVLWLSGIVDSVIVGNTSNDGGGGASWIGPMTNCTIAGNVTIDPDSVGGGVHCDYCYHAVFTGCTIAENAAAGSGGSIGSSSYSSPRIDNCILWGDTPDEIYAESSDPWVTYSDVQGGWTGDGNIDAPPQFLGGESGTWTSDGVYDPQAYQITLHDAGAAWEENELAGKFVNPDVTQVLQFVITANTATTMSVWADWASNEAGASWISAGMDYQIKDYHLTSGSPCIEAGDPDFVSGSADMDDEPRVGDGDGDGTAIVDMGADEYYDCNGNEVADYLDVAEGASLDCNGNGVPDECEGEAVPCGGLDIRPGSCPNPLNRSSQGILPVVLAGTECFDVTQIEVSTVRLSRADGVGGPVAPNEGPPGPHSTFDDVATPFDGEACDCHDLSGDGIVDLVLKFRTDEVVEALLLDELNHGDEIELVVTGSLVGGAEFTTAGDCVLIVPQGTSNANVESNVAGLFVELSPADLNVDDSGFANFQRIYNPGTVITLTAPPRAEGLLFHAWLVDGVVQNAGEATIDVTVVEDLTARALYLSATPGPTLGPRLAPASRQPTSR